MTAAHSIFSQNYSKEVEQLVTAMRITKKGKVPNTAAKHSRYIPKKVAAEVRARDGNCCSFVGKDGKRCSSQWDLEIDHIVPHCLGGANEPSNLQLLCRAHNCHRAEQMFGKEFVQEKIQTIKSNSLIVAADRN